MRADPSSVAAIFSPQHQYVIPVFQRHYVWNRESQWEPLWEDMISQLRIRLDGRIPKPHYCGAIVIDEKRKTSFSDISQFNVIDGQQRLTTFQIILSALRDVCIKHESKQIIPKFGKLLFNATSTDEKNDSHEGNVKLRPTKYDRASFFDVLFFTDREKTRQKYAAVYKAGAHGKSPSKEKDIPNTIAGYLFFYDCISRLLTEPTEHLGGDTYSVDQILSSLFDAFTSDFNSVVIMLDSADDAQVIFESLNYRGQPLLASDLIRNHAFMRAEQNHEDIEHIYTMQWSKFEDKFWAAEDRQGRLKKPRMEFFFANFLSCITGSEINQTRIYQEYLDWINPRKAELNVSTELGIIISHAELYKTLVVPNGDSQLANFARFLSAFDVTIAFPLVMMIFAEASLDDTEKAEMLRDLESYMIRRAVCDRTTKAYNKLFLQAIRDLRSKSLDPYNFRHFLSTLNGDSADWPDDQIFHAAFLKNELYGKLAPSRLVYILNRIENGEVSNFSEKITIGAGLSIEHIMPQSWFGAWPLASGATINKDHVEQAKRHALLGLPLDERSKAIVEREAVVNTIGNLTLITGPLNSSVSNGSFFEKRNKIIQFSALRLNRYFHQTAEWDEKAIAERANVLFETAKKVWPRPYP